MINILGKYTWANGKYFEGQYENGLRNGFGKMFTGDGDTYEGNWVNDKPTGEGVLVQAGVKVPVVWTNGKPVPKEPFVQRPIFINVNFD